MSSEHDATEAYTSWVDVEHYLHAGQSTSFPLRNTHGPRVDYVVTDDRSIALHLELGPRQRLPRSPLPLVRIDEIAQNGVRMARLRLTQERLLRDFHDLLNAVADRVVAHDRTPDQAFNETVRAWSALLEKPRTLDAHARIGLLGELTVLNSLADEHDWETAVDAWTSPLATEHDFGLPDHDIEVKTTSSVRRHHTVHGLGQLAPVDERPLWLVSLQLTRGGTHGRTLPQCVAAVRNRIAQAAPAAVARFDSHLAARGWRSDTSDDERWTMRPTPLVLPVDDRLPRLTPALLAALPQVARECIDAVTYRIDLTHKMSSAEPPAALRAFRLP
ncbi:PD-(D/E)XK motif protein [Streptomyces platensis]|uniref:PD-(D/E)XK motif protein n=1 Tax=Streptomyces platensis TaxID=58346 RepID=UPI00386BE8FF|nr:PD-(D/E)XK motif protein [Streptomyces platensis]